MGEDGTVLGKGSASWILGVWPSCFQGCIWSLESELERQNSDSLCEISMERDSTRLSMGLGLSKEDSLDSLLEEAEEDLMMQLMEEGGAVLPRVMVESSPRALGVEEESGKWKAE